MREGAMMMGEIGPISLLKATRQGAAPVRCGCRSGRTTWGCTLAQPGEYD